MSKVTNYKIGQILYLAFASAGKVSISKWVVRTIRGGKITAIEKNSFTWVKKSRKHFDYGWATNIDCTCRKTWLLEDARPPLYTTRLKAIRAELKLTKAKLKRYESYDLNDNDLIETKKEIKTMERLLV